MRIYSLTLIASAFAFVLTTGCKKSNDSSSSASLTATVGTKTFTPGANQSQAIYNQSGLYFDIAAVSVKPGDTSALEITLPRVSKAGMSVSSDTSVVTINYSGDAGKTVYMAGLGFGGHAIMTVTTQDTVGHKIAGTFTGTVYNLVNNDDSLVVTNGKFNTTYTLQ